MNIYLEAFGTTDCNPFFRRLFYCSKLTMPTVFNRVYAFSKNNNQPIYKEDLLTLGKKVNAKYKETFGKSCRMYVKANLLDFEGYVIYYPKEFAPVIDRVILSFYKSIEKKESIQLAN